MWVDRLAQIAEQYPSKVAVSTLEPARNVTYAELEAEVCCWAGYFYQCGVREGDRVALLAVNRLEHITMFYACAKLGAIFVALNYRLSDGEIHDQLQVVEPKLFFCEGYKPSAFQDFPSQAPVLPETQEPFPVAEVKDDQPLLMLFTSGSSGKPKGVLLHANMLMWNMIHTQKCWELGPEDSTVIHVPFFHTGGLNVFVLPLLSCGGQLTLVSKFDADQVVELIEARRLTVFFGVPTMLSMMAAAPRFSTKALVSLKFCISGGAPCPDTVIEKFAGVGVVLRQGFGLTEVGPNCFAISEDEAWINPQSIGRPMPFSEVAILDDDGHPVPTGEVGEVWFRGPHVCCGYWRNQDAFDEVFRNGYFRTGDLMRKDEAGFYYVVGRKKEMYISGGENVYPGEVVRALVTHPGIEDALVLAVPDAKWGEVGFAYVLGVETPDLASLRAFLNPKLSRYKHPHHIRQLREWPMLANGKIDRMALYQKALAEVEHDG